MDAMTKYFTEGDDGRTLTGEVRGASITGYTILGKLWRPDDTLVTLTGQITDANSGQFLFTFQAAHLIPGRSQFEIVLVMPDGTILHVPDTQTIPIVVRPNLKADRLTTPEA